MFIFYDVGIYITKQLYISLFRYFSRLLNCFVYISLLRKRAKPMNISKLEIAFLLYDPHL